MFDFSVKFTAIDNISSKINKVNSKLNGLDKKFKKLSGGKLVKTIKLKTNQAVAKLKQLEDKISSISRKGIVIGGIGLAGMGKSLSIAKDYELAFRDVKKAVDGTPEQLAKLRNQLKGFAGASFDEISAITAEAGKMGFVADNIFAFSESVIKGAKALDFSGELAVGQVGKILSMTNQMSNAVTAGADIMDKVVHLENNLAGVKGAGVLDIWKRNADLYAQLNFENKSMGAMSAFLSQTSVSSELGATGFKMMLNSFKKTNDEFGYFSKLKLKGLSAIPEIMSEIGKMKGAKQIKEFGTGAMELINKLSSAENIKKLNFALDISGASSGAVNKEWAVFRGTFDQRLGDLKKSMGNTMDSVGTLFIPVITKVADAFGKISIGVNKFIEENPKLAKAIGAIVAIMSGLAVVGGTVALSMYAISLPMLAITAGVALVVTALVGMYYYWEELKTYLVSVKQHLIDLWANFEYSDTITTMLKALSLPFLGLVAIFKTALEYIGMLYTGMMSWFDSFTFVDGAIGYIDKLVQPIKYVMGLIDWLLSKLDIVNNAKAFLSDIGAGINNAYDSVVNFVNGDDAPPPKNATQQNTNITKQYVDIKVSADNNSTAQATQNFGNATPKKLKTYTNGLK